MGSFSFSSKEIFLKSPLGEGLSNSGSCRSIVGSLCLILFHSTGGTLCHFSSRGEAFDGADALLTHGETNMFVREVCLVFAHPYSIACIFW